MQDLKHKCYNCLPFSPAEPRPKRVIYSDVVSHLPVIEYYASLCDHCTEFGVREGNSTVALLSGCGGVVESYDVNRCGIPSELQQIPRWKFHHKSTLDVEIAQTDLIFFDTLHTYDHLKKELSLHGRKARKFLLFHDTFTCGERDVSGSNPNARGILPAIQEYVEEHGDYQTVYQTDFCNGLLVLKRE